MECSWNNFVTAQTTVEKWDIVCFKEEKKIENDGKKKCFCEVVY